MCGVTAAAISNLERGASKEPSWRLAVAIERELRVGARTLFSKPAPKPDEAAETPETAEDVK